MSIELTLKTELKLIIGLVLIQFIYCENQDYIDQNSFDGDLLFAHIVSIPQTIYTNQKCLF